MEQTNCDDCTTCPNCGHDIPEVKRKVVQIIRDDHNDLNPRVDWDNLGTMVCWHSRYNLGDEHQHANPQQFMEVLANEVDPTVEGRIYYWENGDGRTQLYRKYGTASPAKHGTPTAYRMCHEKIQNIIHKALDKHVVILPLHLYDHSGITMRVGGFNDIFDSGQVGYIYITREQILKEYGGKILTRALRNRIEGYLRYEVKTYDHYLTGAVYGFRVFDENGDEEESCWGFFGYDHEESGILGEVQWYLDKGYTLEEVE